MLCLEPGQVLSLENVRFYSGENSRVELDRLAMARHIVSYGDFYVCDTFGTSHQNNSATTVGIPAVMGYDYCAYLIEREIEAIKILGDAPRPSKLSF